MYNHHNVNSITYSTISAVGTLPRRLNSLYMYCFTCRYSKGKNGIYISINSLLIISEFVSPFSAKTKLFTIIVLREKNASS